jgi:hypothetical protein
MRLDEIGYMHAKRILPEPIRVGGECRWREQDIRKFERYLKARMRCRERGIDPDGPTGPAPPIYSTAEKPRFDPRLVVAAEREAERQKRSRTLAAGSAAIEPQEQVTMPEATAKPNKVEG